MFMFKLSLLMNTLFSCLFTLYLKHSLFLSFRFMIVPLLKKISCLLQAKLRASNFLVYRSPSLMESCFKARPTLIECLILSFILPPIQESPPVLLESKCSLA
ncbi:hypothetical protein BD560DRAFT_386072 [Blakeslea trispora]|nr:hypothetical protein BD560DRAFT_386072 [Blakeslea trispora]